MKNLGFIGAGRMATALARGCVTANLVGAEGVLASDPHQPSREKFAEELPGARVTGENAAVLSECDTVVLAVKPQMMDGVLAEIRPHVEGRHLLVSIAAGVTLERLARQLPASTRLIRVMPNTPCLIGQGASAFALDAAATAEDAAMVERLLASVGKSYEVEEPLLDAVTGLSGSGPAFVYTVIEAMAAGGVAGGLSPELALELATQTAAGAAAMVAQTGLSPAELRSHVTSPNGTTLAGLNALAERNGSAAIQAAVEAATNRSIELGKS
ncbi:pyrroline-5-carboxylate reductase [Lacipirellula limnantheis]|uniref:Pyrroline-5-carboxylate reductase n=1 Tax=Lacipirellula limnantheis TaxID=2528024 RepID=A0A517U355_9BACT|nr:pyrroline-5-carboxylate reductase [Lacipirellula limnantheis]QDT75055.1 Pyrroline-5-carboxylate reductase [Lacipirellula limnantheis]